MRRLISLVVATVLTSCATPDGAAAPDPRAAAYAEGRCFRAQDVTNYNVEAPHAVFVLTRRGSVFGLIAQDCFRKGSATVSLAQSRRGNPLLCPGDQIEVTVSEWAGRGADQQVRESPCLARITDPIQDADVSGFRARGAAG